MPPRSDEARKPRTTAREQLQQQQQSPHHHESQKRQLPDGVSRRRPMQRKNNNVGGGEEASKPAWTTTTATAMLCKQSSEWENRYSYNGNDLEHRDGCRDSINANNNNNARQSCLLASSASAEQQPPTTINTRTMATAAAEAAQEQFCCVKAKRRRRRRRLWGSTERNAESGEEEEAEEELQYEEAVNTTTTTTPTTTTTTLLQCQHYNNTNMGGRKCKWRINQQSPIARVAALPSPLWALCLLLLTATLATGMAAAAATAAATGGFGSGSGFMPSLGQQQQQGQQQLQKRQLQQRQHLFALLTNNRVGVDGGGSSSSSGGANRGPVLMPPGRRPANDVALEITGFVADDGQQYEKASRVPSIKAAMNAPASGGVTTNAGEDVVVGGGDCPKECKCLSDFFDCSKKYLNRVPALPNYVQILDLMGSNLNDSTVLQLRNLPELHKLSLKRNQLEQLPQFVGLLQLKQLNLAHNRIRRLNGVALAALPRLKVLDLSRNQLHEVGQAGVNGFPAGNRLAHLLMNGNAIAHVDETAFDTLGDLIELDLSNNSLSALPGGVFRSLNKLKKLSMNFNKLEVNWSTFRGLVAVQRLALKGNRIRGLQDGVFHVMRAIEMIELDHNAITVLSRQGLFNLTRLQVLSVSNNSIGRIEPDTWEFTQSLVKLDLSYNNISEFRPQHLDCLRSLNSLNLAHNKIHYLADGMFNCATNLEKLNLRSNRLSWIIEDASAPAPFKALRHLRTLDLYGNHLKQLSARALSGLTSLEVLNLGGNALASVQMGAFDATPALQRLNFKSQNFICDCELLWFRRWLLQKSAASGGGGGAGGGGLDKQTNAVCGFPEQLLDRELLTLAPAELICAESPKPTIVSEPSNQLAVKGANLTMECVAHSPDAAVMAATDELKIKWRHDSQLVRSGLKGVAIVPHGGGVAVATEMQIDREPVVGGGGGNQTTIIGRLRLFNVSSESAGRYQCVVSNAFGTTYSQKFKISIGIQPAFLQVPSNLTIDSGDTARLVCSASGDPPPEIALLKFGASYFPAAMERRLSREENAFIIMNAKPMDTGVYTCTAESAAGEIRTNATLVVNDKPLPALPHARLETVVGESSVLACLNELASGELRPPVRRDWYKDNKPFAAAASASASLNAAERFYFTADRELLVIVDTQSADAGQYRCDMSDATRTFGLPTELVVVKEDLNMILVIIGAVVVGIICLLVGTVIVWLLLCWQRRKTAAAAAASAAYGNGHGSNGTAGEEDGVGGNGNTGDREAAHDYTQLTTLSSRSYVQPSAKSAFRYQTRPLLAAACPTRTSAVAAAKQRRPRSLADLEMHVLSDYDYRLGHSGSRSRQLPFIFGVQGMGRNGVGRIDGDDDDDGLTLTYLAEQEHDHHHHRDQPLSGQQPTHAAADQLSSKDSGTGSDAAAKRSLEDFSVLLPQAHLAGDGHDHLLLDRHGDDDERRGGRALMASSTPLGSGRRRASLAQLDSDHDDYEEEDGEDDDDDGGEDEDAALAAGQLRVAHALGLSTPYEADRRRRHQQHDHHSSSSGSATGGGGGDGGGGSSSTRSPTPTPTRTHAHSSGDSSATTPLISPPASPATALGGGGKCAAEISTKFNASRAGATAAGRSVAAQAVDI